MGSKTKLHFNLRLLQQASFVNRRSTKRKQKPISLPKTEKQRRWRNSRYKKRYRISGWHKRLEWITNDVDVLQNEELAIVGRQRG